MEESIEAHYQASLKTAQYLDGGPFSAYPSGKSWDEASGKKFCHSVISAQPSYAEIIVPVIHYRKDGLELDEDSTVMGPGLKPVPDLCASKEVVGGVHGKSRWGDNSLGLVARTACAKYVLDDRVKATYLAALGGGELRGRKVNRPSLLAVVGPIRQQSTPNWKNVGSMVLLDKSSFCDDNSTVVIAVEGTALSDKVA